MNIVGILLGIFLCLGGIAGYIPQFHNIVRYQSVKGISELSLMIMNLGLMFLTMNSIIFSWPYFFCKDAGCFTNLFPVLQILMSWIMVLIFYIIFIVYKFRKRDKYKKRLLYGTHYIITYLLFIVFVTTLAIGEKYGGHDPVFFKIFADVLGYTSAILNGIVYLPQIYTLYKDKSPGNLSFLMYMIQTPGNIIIIYFQAIIYEQAVSTWITYVIVFIEQMFILFLMGYYKYYFVEQETEEQELIV